MSVLTSFAGLGLFVCTALLAAAPASAWAAANPQMDIVMAAADAPLAGWIVPVAETDELEGPSASERRDEKELSDKDDGGLGDLDDRSYEGSDIDADMERTQREARRNRAYMGEGGAAPRGRGRGRDLAY